MSTRSSTFVWWRIHVFRDVVAKAYFLDFGKGTYNRAWQIWPPWPRRLY